jgi:hypothetical protein
MDTEITINTHDYSTRKQLPTSNVRSTFVSGVPYIATAGYQETKEGGYPVIRSQRKIEKTVTLTDGSKRQVSAQAVFSLPTDCAVTDLDSVEAELLSWMGQTDFLSEVKAQSI